MNWLEAMLMGSLGGAVVELVDFWGSLMAWKKDRQECKAGKKPPPSLRSYLDLTVSTSVIVTRMVFGGVACLALHEQLAGSAAAIVAGAAGPAVLSKLGSGRVSFSLQDDDPGHLDEKVRVSAGEHEESL